MSRKLNIFQYILFIEMLSIDAYVYSYTFFLTCILCTYGIHNCSFVCPSIWYITYLRSFQFQTKSTFFIWRDLTICKHFSLLYVILITLVFLMLFSNLLFTSFNQLEEAVRAAFDVAYNNIFAFHAAQKPGEKIIENMTVSCLHLLFQFLEKI